MAGKSLNELNLKDEALPDLDYASVPEFGGWAPPPQPGAYRFALPKDLSKVWEAYEKDGKQFVRAVFDKDAPLVITQAKDQKYVGDPFETRISNQTRPRGREKVEVSDMDLVLKAVGQTSRPKGNKGYIEVMKAQVGKEFGADITYSWNCAEDRVQRVLDDQGKNIENPNGKKGCGKKFYQDDRTAKPEQKITRQPNGEYPYEIQCPCGGIVRAFANLDNIRS